MNKPAQPASVLHHPVRIRAGTVLLALLALLHLSHSWLTPPAVSAATRAPEVQVTFAPDVLPVDMTASGDAAKERVPQWLETDEQIPGFSQGETMDTGPDVLPMEAGSVHLGYAYEVTDGKTLVHLWYDGQEITLDAMDPGTYAYMERFKRYATQYADDCSTFHSWIWKAPAAVLVNLVEYTALTVTGIAALAACVAAPFTGITAVGCITGAALFASESILFSIARFERQMAFNSAVNRIRDHQDMLEAIEETWETLQEITSRREEPGR